MDIFILDIDGVISTSQCWGRGNDNKWGTYMFDPKCVSLLNFLNLVKLLKILPKRLT